MKLPEILEKYSDEALDRLARDKIDEIANLRFPRALLLREVAAALASRSYVARALAPTRPPAHAFLKLLIEATGLEMTMDGFREAALELTDSMSASAKTLQDLSPNKNFHLYLQVLFAAWEDDGRVDTSEARMLEALRRELGISVREHLLLEHHPEVRPLWDSPRSYEDTRSHLLSTGLVLMHEGKYLLAEEVAQQIRACWDMPLEDVSYARLLDRLTAAQLHEVLEAAGLQVGGSKEEKIGRVVRGLLSPFEVLDRIHTNDVKQICRSCTLAVSGSKAELIANIVDYFDADLDLRAIQEAERAQPAAPSEPEPRIVAREVFEALLTRFTSDQLYDMLAGSNGPRSGSKQQRISNILATPFSERSLLAHVRRAELVDACRRAGIGVSGPKEELIDRLVAWASKTPMHELRGDQATATEVAKLNEAVAPASEPNASKELRPPPGVKGVQADFPELDSEERIILALLKDARSLTESEIARAAERHGLGWFLLKAHMADMVAKLSRNGRSPVRIRSAAGVNVYEWIGRSESTEPNVDREATRDVIDALRQGVVPESHLDLLAVGQDEARKHLVDLLLHVRSGRTAFKFIRGPYGAGKTFVCSWLREQAFKHDLAVASVRIGPDQPLSDLPVFFAGLMNGLRTPEKTGAGALADVLESWLLATYRRTAHVEGINPSDPGAREKLAPFAEKRMEEEAARLSKHDPGFGPALMAFYRARVEGDESQASTAIAWLRGSSSSASSKLREIGVSGHLESHHVFPRMRALLEVIQSERLRGLLVFVDELELVRRFPHQRQREAAYETLRSLVDECGENKLPGCFLAFTATDALFEDQKYGLPSYQALVNRIEVPRGVDGRVSMRQPVIQLRGLDRDRLLAVSARVRDLHASAYGWPAAERVPDSVLTRLVEGWTEFGGENVERLPRPILRELVHVLDLCEENRDVDAADFLPSPVQTSDLATSVVDLLEA
jgi:hypothetical protein